MYFSTLLNLFTTSTSLLLEAFGIRPRFSIMLALDWLVTAFIVLSYYVCTSFKVRAEDHE